MILNKAYKQLEIMLVERLVLIMLQKLFPKRKQHFRRVAVYRLWAGGREMLNGD